VADIDATLAHRAEQALLGALLAGASPAVVGDIRPADFGVPEHRAIYAAISGQFGWGGPAGRVRAWAGRAVGLRAVQVAEYAGGLPACCPRRDHLLAYGAMVLEGRQRPLQEEPRGSGGPDRQLAGADLWLSSATGRHHRARGGGQRGPADGRGRLALGTVRLARALAPALGQLRDQVTAGRGGGGIGDGVVLATRGTGAVTAADLQELVLAGLMRHPGEGQRLVGRVPPQVFGAGERRELYAVVARLIAGRLPVDPLIAAWRARRSPGAAGAGEAAAALALRLGEVAPPAGLAAYVCRGLLADYELTTRFGRDWPRRELGWGDQQPGPAARDGPRLPEASPGAARTIQAPGPSAGVQGIRRP
jgi:hypothetical protein